MRLPPIWAGFAGHVGCTAPDQRFSLPGTDPGSGAVAHRKARVIPAFGVALGAAFLGGVLAAPGWAQSSLFGPCVNDDMTPVSDPCLESIEWAGGTANGFVGGVDEVVWRVTIRGSSPIKRKPDFAEGSIDDAVVVTANPGPNPSPTVSEDPVEIADGVGRYRYNVKVPIVRQYDGTVTLTLGAFEDTSGNGITAGQTPRGENQRTFTVSNVHQIADLRTVRIANGLRVRWRAARSASAGYLVRWKEETGTFNQGQVVMTGTSYDITGLTVGTTYTVSVDTRNTGQGPMGRDTFRNSGLEVTRRVLDQLADIPSTGSVDADSDSTSIGSPVLPENGQNSYKIVSWTATDSGYGSYEVARGHSGGTVYIWRWFYRLNKDNEEVKALAPGDTLTDTFTMEDNSEPPREATVTITITKSPPPTIICIKVGIDILGHDDGCVDEDLDILATEDSPVTQWRGRAVVTDPDAPDRSFIPVQTRGTYGKFSLGADGLWVYALKNADPDTNALGVGQAGLDEFMIETVDGVRAAPRKIRVGVWGANDPATFGGKLSGSVTEDVPFTYEACIRRNNPDPRTEGYMCLERGTVNLGVITSGKVTVSDPDSNNASALKKRQGVQKGTYGSLFVNADQGYWRYVLDNDSSHVQGLTAGATVTETFTILAADDTPATVTITITGTRDISTIEGAMTGSVTEGGVNTRASGTVRVTFNAATNQFRARSNIRGNYGTFNIDTRGNWTYDLDGGDLLREGEVVYEPFRVESTLQNRTTAVVVIKVTGSDVVGAITASVGMDAGSRTSGRLTGHRGFEIGAHTRRGDFGCLIIQGNGTWEYLVYDTAPSSDCQASSGTQTATAGDSESFDLLFSRARYGDACSPDDSLDCVSIPESVQFIERTLTININAGIAAVFDASTLTGAITEDTATTSGTVRATDADGDDNKFTAAGSSNPISGDYGSLTITEDGAWTYRLFNTLSAVQALGQGATLNDSLTIQAADGTTGTLVITITGADDQATIGGTVNGFVTEDAVKADNSPDNQATGIVTLRDVDGGSSFTAQTNVAGKYGTFSLNATSGAWTYSLDNSDSDTNALRAGQTVNDETFAIAASDGASATVTITITGTNDAATFGGTVHGSVTEDATETMATGTMTVTDVDGDNTLQARTLTGTYGDFVVNADGTWTYTLVNSRAATNALREGQTTSEGLQVSASDGTSGPTIIITVTGADDLATFGGDLAGSVTEDAVKADNSPDNQATGTVTLSDVDGGSSLTAQTDTPGKYGTFSLNATSGVWTYSLDNSDPDTNALRSDQTVNDETFDIAASDGASATVTISITGADDPSTIGGTLAGAVTEDATVTTAGGTASITSTDNTVTFTAQTDVDGTYGTFSLATTGVWTYTLDNSDTDTNALADGVEETDSFTIATSDGSTAAVVITVTGADDQATIGGDLAGSVTEDAVKADNSPDNQATGTATLSDVDGGSSLTAQTDAPGKYGTFSLNATSGAWTYSLDNSDPDTNALRAGQTVNDETFDIAASDGASATVTISITGADDPSTIGGTLAGAVTEDATVTTAEGMASITDVDSTVTFTAQTDVDGTYGTFNLATTGVWTYTLDNSDTDTNALADGVEETDSFAIATSDGSTASVVITVTGADDQATIEGDLAGSVTEDATETMATGTVTLSDVDGGSSLTAQTDTPGKYGTFSLNATSGVWTYSLDNSDPDTNALRSGQTVNDETFAIAASDGASETVTITITGADDPSIIGGTLAGAVTEDAAVTSARGTASITDVDSTATFTAQTNALGRYGTFSLATSGVWTYSLDNSDTDTNALKEGVEMTDSFTIVTSDGSTAAVVITVTGANDAASITGTLAGSVMEDGTLTASGSVTVTDVDGDDALKQQADQTGKYGSLSVDHSAGSWTYTLNNSADAVQELTGGVRETDTFTILAADDTPATVTITITGAIDPGDIAGASGSVTEDDTLKARARGRVMLDGVSDATFTAQTNIRRTYGTFNLEANGNWTYDLDNSRPVTNALAGGAEVRDTLEIATADNSATAALIITVTGNDDRSTIDAANLAGFVMEDGTLMASATVTVTDVDSSPAPAIKARSDFSSAYGTFGITSAGVWTYTLDNNAAAVQALGDEQTLTEAFRINTVDGAEAVVTITITGTDDTNEIEGTVTGSVTEDDEEASSARGRVTVTGSAGAIFAVKATNPPQSQTYGTFTIQPDGNWTYSLDNDKSMTNALTQGATATESITIEALEGDTSVDEKVVTITITGANDVAVFGAAGLTGAITEDAVPNTTTGTATVTDVDGDNRFSTEVAPNDGTMLTTGTGSYGSLTITEDGAWTYTLNNADPDTNALTAGQKVTDSFTIKASDGTETAVTITVTGVTDKDEIEGDVSGSVREAAGDEDAPAMASGRVRVAGDSAARFTVQMDTPTTYGTFSLTAEGVWTYRLDNDRGVTDALRQGRTVTEIITVEIDEATASDTTPRTATVTITVMGSEVGGDLTGSIREGSQTPVVGKLTTEQDYEIVDVEDIRRGEFGCLRVRSDGSWTYWLFGTDRRLCPRPIEALAQSGTVTVLAAEQARMDVFMIEVMRSDGTMIMVSLTITIEEAAAPVTRTVAVTGYLQGRAEVLLGKQPGLGGFLKDLRSGIISEGQVSVDVRDGALLGFDGSFVRDGFWGALSVARSEQGSGKTDQIFGTLGYHGQVADAALVGLMLQFDQADGRLDAGLGSIDGQGWLFGPYFATQYQAQPQVSPLTLEGRLLYGPTRNDVRFVDGGTGSFDTQRWLASFRLEGEVLLDYGDRAIRLIPHFDGGWVQDKVEAFTDSAGMQVAGQTIRFSEVALGSDIEVPVRFGQRDALITGGLSLVSTREQSQGQNARVSVSDTHGRLELGLGYRLANGIELEFGGSYDDVEGTDSEDKFSLSFGLSNQF